MSEYGISSNYRMPVQDRTRLDISILIINLSWIAQMTLGPYPNEIQICGDENAPGSYFIAPHYQILAKLSADLAAIWFIIIFWIFGKIGLMIPGGWSCFRSLQDTKICQGTCVQIQATY